MFLLSVEELEKYMPSLNDRIAYPTTYAREMSFGQNAYQWWLRTPGYKDSQVLTVKSDGSIDPYKKAKVDYQGVRPALWIQFEP